MSQIFTDHGNVAPVTVLKVGPGIVTQLKHEDSDGYRAVQIAFGERKVKNVSDAVRGHTKEVLEKTGIDTSKYGVRWLREGQLDPDTYSIGDMIDISLFEVGDMVTVTGTTKGKGFQGGMKRHGFHGAKEKTHGTKHSTREVGSIGATGPQRVFKGRKMPGRMGSNRVTVKNLRVEAVDTNNHLLFVRGAVPGVRGGLVEVSASK